jgi:hypothetical protein
MTKIWSFLQSLIGPVLCLLVKFFSFIVLQKTEVVMIDKHATSDILSWPHANCSWCFDRPVAKMCGQHQVYVLCCCSQNFRCLPLCLNFHTDLPALCTYPFWIAQKCKKVHCRKFVVSEVTYCQWIFKKLHWLTCCHWKCAAPRHVLALLVPVLLCVCVFFDSVVDYS